MNISGMLCRNHRVFTALLLLMLGVSVLLSFAQHYVSATAEKRAAARYDDLIDNHRITDLDALVGELAYYQFGGLPPLPGTNLWDHHVGPLPVDWANFPEALTTNLIGYWEGDIPVYDLYVFQDQDTREIVFLNSDQEEIYSIDCPYGAYCDPATYALYRYPDLYSGKYTQAEIEYLIAHCDPARLGVWFKLIPTEDLYDYLLAQAQSESLFQALTAESSGGGGMEMMMSGSGGSGPLNDLDGDGIPNRDEILAGTDPEDSSDFLRITNIQLSAGSREISWPSVSNRQYSVLTTTGGVALLSPQAWSIATQWLDGTDSGLVFTDGVSDVEVAFHHVQVRETDANTNGLPDWWEIEHFGGLTNISASGDEDNDGLNNLEEVYYGYSPTNSERILYHSIFYVVEVNTNTPSSDDGTERFDFHGGGRPLSLASNATDYGYVGIYGESSSGGIYFNNDQSNLYIGIAGLFRGSDNAFLLFIDSGSGGITNLGHFAGNPYALGIADNIGFDAGSFTPNVALVLGGNYGDGKNYHDYSIGGRNFGQGVYELGTSSNISDFAGFNTTGGCPISQWSTNATGEESPRNGVEVSLSLAALGVAPGDTIQAAAVFIGGEDGPNRYVIDEAYGKSISGSGISSVSIVGSDIQLASVDQTLPPNSYPGFTDDDIMFQAFYWDVEPRQGWYDTVVTQVAGLAQAGFTMTWMPVPCKADNPAYSMGYAPYDHYDLGEYSYESQTETRFGSRAELANLIATLIATNIIPLCDVVLNHMGGGSGVDGTTFDYPHDTFEKSATDFHPSGEGHNDELYPYHNNWGFGGEDADPLDVAFLAPNMRLGFKQWGGWLVTNVGFGGFRFDFTEGVEPWFLWEWLHYPEQRPLFAFFEYWKEADGTNMREWLDLTGREGAIYDWNLQIILEEMSEDDGTSFDMTRLKAPSLLGIEPNYTVTFVENHDTLQPSGTNTTAEHQGVAKDKQLGYAYILHSQGLPLVFYRDYYLEPYFNVSNGTHFGTNLKTRIDRLIEIRKATVAGGVQYLNTNANLLIQQRDGGAFKPGSILVLNDDASSTLSNAVATIFTNTVLIDLVATNSPHSVTTDVNGVVSLSAPPRDYRVYGLTNSLTE